MADQRRRSPLPPLYSGHRTHAGRDQVPVREFKNPAYVEDDDSQQRKVSPPLPDYNTLFPQKRHGVQGETRWDNLVSEFSKKHGDCTPELMGPEMSVDGPVDQTRSRLHEMQENPDIRKHQETKPVSTKKFAAPAPPRHSASQVPPSAVESGQRHGQKVTPHSLLKSLSPTSKTTTTASSRTSKDEERKEPHSSAAATPTSRPPSRSAADTAPLDDQRKPQVSSNKEAPTAKPRQRVSGTEPAKQKESAVKPSVQTSSLNMSSMNKKERENFANFLQYSNSERLSQDSRGKLKPDQESGNVRREQTDNSDNGFNQEKQADTLANLNGNDSVKQAQSRKKDEHSNPGSPAFQRRNSSRRKIPLPSIRSENIFTSQQEPESKEPTASTTTSQVVSARGGSKAFAPAQPESDLKPENGLYGEEDPSPSAFPSSQPLSVVLEEPGKPLLKAWVSPSEAQPVSTQSNNGGGLGLSPRRPHPVKPMSSSDSQSTSSPAAKEIKVWDTTPGKIKLEDSVGSSPYSQLTTEELIKLVVKQQTDLSKKDAKITELEEYIDNLLVRVIEEKPTILQSLTVTKPV